MQLEDRERIKAVLTGARYGIYRSWYGAVVQVQVLPKVIAEVAKELGVLTVAVVTKPFSFEGKKRLAFAGSKVSKSFQTCGFF